MNKHGTQLAKVQIPVWSKANQVKNNKNILVFKFNDLDVRNTYRTTHKHSFIMMKNHNH